MEAKTVTIDTAHAHRWRIDEPNGQTSRGFCRVCGVERIFKNWLEDSDFITNTEHRMAA
jgi:hypothetical protein